MKKAKEELLIFYSENKSITIMFILSICINFFYGITNHLPELFINAEFWFDFLRQIGLAIIASFVFYIFIEYIPSKRENKKFTKIVLSQMKHPLIQHIRLLMYMYKASIKDKPSVLPTNLQELFTDNYLTIIEELDFNCQAPIVKKQTWSMYTYNECLSFSHQLETILIKYSSYLKYDLIELIEGLSKTVFMRFVLDNSMLRRYDNNVWKHEDNIFSNNKLLDGPNLIFKSKLEDDNYKHLLKDHLNKVLEIIELYNKCNPKKVIELDIQLWSDDIAPLYGDSRINKSRYEK